MFGLVINGKAHVFLEKLVLPHSFDSTQCISRVHLQYLCTSCIEIIEIISTGDMKLSTVNREISAQDREISRG